MDFGIGIVALAARTIEVNFVALSGIIIVMRDYIVI